MERLAGSSYVERGSPATLIYYDQQAGEAYLIDPGQGEDRPRRLRRDLEQLGAKTYQIVLTHYHSDHLEAVARLNPSEVVASELDAPAVKRSDIRVALTYGIQVDPADPVLLFRAPDIPVTKEVKPEQGLYGPLRLVPLPGHTEGHMAVMTPDGVIHVGDALFGDKTIARYGIPYHRRICSARQSLDELARVAASAEYIVPGHGPVVKGQDATELIELNVRRLDEVMAAIETSLKEPSSVESIMASLVRTFKPQEMSAATLLLLRTTVEGYIACLRSRGLVEPAATSDGLLWKLTA